MNIANILKLIGDLRHPETGCPWDRQQTMHTLIKPLRSEVDELAQAIEQGDREHICEELGDVFFNVCQLLCVAHEEGLFPPQSSVDGVIEKMIRRHPHVFGDEKARDADHAAELYQQAKIGEKGGQIA